jgi:hypothetical protein
MKLLVTFDDIADPAPEELSRVRHCLGDASVEQVTPGVLAVDGALDVVRKALADMPAWRVQAEQRLSMRSPSRSRLKRVQA